MRRLWIVVALLAFGYYAAADDPCFRRLRRDRMG